MRYLLDKDVEESVTQSVLNAIQGLINITGTIYLRQA
jgi:hypothetical protein